MAYEIYCTKVPYKKGALEFLEYCKAHGKEAGGGDQQFQRTGGCSGRDPSLSTGYFDCIMTSCEARRGKPAPDVYLAVAERLGVEPSRCLVFEDLPAGIKAGNAAGMTVIAIEDDYSKGDESRKKQELARVFYQ